MGATLLSHGGRTPPSSPWPPRIVSLPSSPSTASDPALAQITSSLVVPVSVSSAAVPVIVHSVRAPATVERRPWANAGPTIRPTVAMLTKMARVLTLPPLELAAVDLVAGVDPAGVGVEA